VAALSLAAFALNKNRIAGVYGAFHPEFRYQPSAPPERPGLSGSGKTISEGVGAFVGASHPTPKNFYTGRLQGISTSAGDAKISAGFHKREISPWLNSGLLVLNTGNTIQTGNT
jgi:hypothetical protein